MKKADTTDTDTIGASLLMTIIQSLKVSLQLNEVKLSYYGVADHLLSGFWSVFRAETSLTH